MVRVTSGEHSPEEQGSDDKGPAEERPASSPHPPPGYRPAPGGYGYVPEDYRWEDPAPGTSPPGTSAPGTSPTGTSAPGTGPPGAAGYGTTGYGTTGHDTTGRGTTGYGPGHAGAPSVPAGTPVLAHWADRAMSGLVDFFVPYFVSVYLYLFGDNRLSVLVLIAASAWGLYNGYLQGVTGQSVGKRLTGIRTVREQDGQPLGGGQGFGRAFLHLLDMAPCGFGFLMPIWDAKRQTFADKVMGTVVVRR
jgi:uncharacterized RDD family membrane protein YckC